MKDERPAPVLAAMDYLEKWDNEPDDLPSRDVEKAFVAGAAWSRSHFIEHELRELLEMAREYCLAVETIGFEEVTSAKFDSTIDAIIAKAKEPRT